MGGEVPCLGRGFAGGRRGVDGGEEQSGGCYTRERGAVEDAVVADDKECTFHWMVVHLVHGNMQPSVKPTALDVGTSRG